MISRRRSFGPALAAQGLTKTYKAGLQDNLRLPETEWRQLAIASLHDAQTMREY